LEVYIWLSYKYEKEFIERKLAQETKNRICFIIEKLIEETDNPVAKEKKIQFSKFI
jgi:hypothetical protein